MQSWSADLGSASGRGLLLGPHLPLVWLDDCELNLAIHCIVSVQSVRWHVGMLHDYRSLQFPQRPCFSCDCRGALRSPFSCVVALEKHCHLADQQTTTICKLKSVWDCRFFAVFRSLCDKERPDGTTWTARLDENWYGVVWNSLGFGNVAHRVWLFARHFLFCTSRPPGLASNLEISV